MGPLLFRILLVIDIFVIVTETSTYSYRFKVYPVDECPKNKTEFEAAAKRRNCTGDTRYLCAPDKNLTSLIEFCTDQKTALFEKDNCIKLEGTGNLNHYKCVDKFISGCPTTPYTDEEIYDYPACISINKDLMCFVAEKDCQERHSAPNESYKNESSIENGKNTINPKGIPTTFLIVVILLLGLLILLGLTLFLFYKKRKKRKANEIHADGTKIEEKIKVDDLPVGKKIIERDTVKEIHLDATKENKNGQVDELEKLRQFLSQKELSVCHLRCIIVGCTGAGKTTLLRRLGNPSFEILNSMKPTEIVDVHDYSFEVLEDDETIQNLSTFHERDKNDTSDSEDTSEETKLLCLSQCKKEKVKEHGKNTENRKLLPCSPDNILTNSVKNCSPLYPEKNDRKSSSCIRDDMFLEDDGRYATLKSTDDAKKLPSENPIRPRITFLDISCPSMFNAFQHIYFSPKTCYIMVLDMTKSPSDHVLEHAVGEIDCSRSKLWKYKDLYKLWLQSIPIHSYSDTRTPVILVGTHGDKMSKANCRKFFQEVFEIFDNYPNLKRHLHPDRTFAIGFPKTGSGLENLMDIKKCFAKLVRDSTSFEERIRPVWVKFEDILQRKKIQRIISRKLLAEINNRQSEMLRIDEEEVTKMLCFLHRVGTLLYFDEKGLNETVVLDIQWFVDAFKTIISFSVDINDTDPSLERFKSTGVLDDEDVYKIWKSRAAKDGYVLYKKQILAYMERLGLLAIIYENETLYYIPSMNKRKFETNDIHTEDVKSSILCFCFDEEGQLPVFIFYGIVLRCMKIPEWTVLRENDKLCLYENSACFLLRHHIVVVCLCKYKIQVQVWVPARDRIDVNFLKEIQLTVEGKIQEYKGYTYEIGYKCQNVILNTEDNSFIARAKFPISTRDCQNCKGDKTHSVDNTICWILPEKEKVQEIIQELGEREEKSTSDKVVDDMKEGEMENPLYMESRTGIKFAKLINYLAEHFPHEKLPKLKYLLKGSGKLKDTRPLQSAMSAMECFTILLDKNLFGQNDVIFMQFLCNETKCKELYTKCIEYATNENVLCCFERPLDKGRKNVEFHIQGELKDYSKEKIMRIVEVVADILCCKAEEILVNGVRPSASFYLVLSIQEDYTWKLSNMNEEDLLRLTKFNIDFLNFDENTITINSENGNLKPCGPISPVHKTEDSSFDQDWKETEIRIVLLEKTESVSSASASSVTSDCLQKHAVSFGHKIAIVDTPGISDTETMQNEIQKCLRITSPGPHAFILVLSPSRYTMEEQKLLKYFVDYFGERFYNYLIILFTRKDDLDAEGEELTDESNTAPVELKALIEKCGRRVIAFNEKLKGEQQNAQVINLLSMIWKNIKSNDVEYYPNEMFTEPEKQLRKRNEGLMINANVERREEFIEIQSRPSLQIESKIAEEAKRDKETLQQCEGLLMKKSGE